MDPIAQSMQVQQQDPAIVERLRTMLGPNSAGVGGSDIPGLTTPGQLSPGAYQDAMRTAGIQATPQPAPMSGKAGGNAQPQGQGQPQPPADWQQQLNSRAGQAAQQSPMSDGKASQQPNTRLQPPNTGGGKQGLPSQSSFQGSPFGGGQQMLGGQGFPMMMPFQGNPMPPGFNNPGFTGLSAFQQPQTGSTPATQGYQGAQAGALGNPNQGGYNGIGRSEMATPGLSAFGQMAGGVGSALGSTFGSGASSTSAPAIPNAASQVFH